MYMRNKTTFESIYDVVLYVLLGSLFISGSFIFVAVGGYVIHGTTPPSFLTFGVISLLAGNMFLLVILVAMTLWELVFE